MAVLFNGLLEEMAVNQWVTGREGCVSQWVVVRVACVNQSVVGRDGCVNGLLEGMAVLMGCWKGWLC